MTAKAIQGIGIGLRYAMAEATLSRDVPGLGWLEIHPENYVERGGRFRQVLERAAEKFPFATHGLTLGFGAAEPAEARYMRALRDFLHGLSVPWHSEHLCFSSSGGVMVHDLLPLPFTHEAVATAAARIGEARDQLELPIAIENISYYATLGRADEQQMGELEFLLEVLERADAKLLLDVNNVFVNSQNHRFDPRAYIDRIPVERSRRSTSRVTTSVRTADHRHPRRGRARRGVRLAGVHAQSHRAGAGVARARSRLPGVRRDHR